MSVAGMSFASHTSRQSQSEDVSPAASDELPKRRPTEFSDDTIRRVSVAAGEQCCFSMLRQWCASVCRRSGNATSRHPQSNTIATPRRKLFPLERPYRTIKISDKNSVSLACNDRHILLKRAPYLCLLSKQLTIAKLIPWSDDQVHICWSSTLVQFILITDESLFTFDDNTMVLDPCPLPHDKPIRWAHGACSNASLFLSTEGTSTCLHQYTLAPSIEFVKERQLISVDAKHDGIVSFICANEKLALVIYNFHTHQRRVELRTCETLERLWSLRLEAVAHCCAINGDQWMIMELLKPRLLHVNADGEVLQEYRTKPSEAGIVWNAAQFGQDTLATFTMTNLSLHKLS